MRFVFGVCGQNGDVFVSMSIFLNPGLERRLSLWLHRVASCACEEGGGLSGVNEMNFNRL